MSRCHFCDAADDLRPFAMRSRDLGGEWSQAVACARCWARLRPELRHVDVDVDVIEHEQLGLFGEVAS